MDFISCFYRKKHICLRACYVFLIFLNTSLIFFSFFSVSFYDIKSGWTMRASNENKENEKKKKNNKKTRYLMLLLDQHMQTRREKTYHIMFGVSSWCPRGVMVKAMNCGIVVREFLLQSRYYVHFRANTLGKGMNPLILPPAIGK